MTQFENDSELWDSLRSGNRLALNVIYSRHFPALYKYGVRFSQDTDLVQESIQNLFLNIWVKKEKHPPVKNLRSYLISSLRNQIINSRLSESKVQKVDLESHEVFDLHFSVESSFIEREEQHEKSRTLSLAMDKLTARQKEIIYLRYFEEMDYLQIAEIMDLSLKGTYKLSARALEALRLILNIDKAMLLAMLMALKH